jgi:hypothetical protein
MRHLFNSSAAKWGLLVTVIALTLLVVLLSALPSAAQGTIHKVYVTSVNDTSFAVSWTTDAPVTSTVKYSINADLSSPTYEKADSLNPTATTAHYVLITGLSEGITYYFDTVSGSITDNNGGAHYSVATGPTFGSPPGAISNLYGRVLYAGTPVNNIPVYIQAEQCTSIGGGVSQLASNRTTANYWSYNTGNFRNSTLQYQCVPATAGQIVTVTAQGGISGTGQITYILTTAGTQALPDIILAGAPNAITLRSLSSHTESSVWVPIGLALLGTATIVVIVARKRRS